MSRDRDVREEHQSPDDDDDAIEVREIHALSSPHPSSSSTFSSRGDGRRRESWDVSRSSSLSIASSDAENFTSMSREFSALVVAGSTMQSSSSSDHNTATTTSAGSEVMTTTTTNLGRIREEEQLEETNPLAIVPDTNPMPSPRRRAATSVQQFAPASSLVDNITSNGGGGGGGAVEEVSVQRVKKEEVQWKIAAWQTAVIAKINNRFKREDVIINGWESEQIEKATACLKRTERKLDEQRARAVERMQNNVARARRKAEEKRASTEAKRGTKVAKVFELANLLRAVGRAPSKRSFF